MWNRFRSTDLIMRIKIILTVLSYIICTAYELSRNSILTQLTTPFCTFSKYFQNRCMLQLLWAINRFEQNTIPPNSDFCTKMIWILRLRGPLNRENSGFSEKVKFWLLFQSFDQILEKIVIFWLFVDTNQIFRPENP